MRYNNRRGESMPLSLRIPSKKEEMIKKAAVKAGKTKSAYIIDAVDEKLGLVKNRENMIRELAGWLSKDEAEELRKATEVFSQINNGDWV
jgi:predicted DNA-binding protein